METEKFEEKLIQMTKPEVSQLKHQDMLEVSISKAKDKSVLSLWWLAVPLYMMAALFMKVLFMPDTTFISNLREVMDREKISSFFFFLLVPVVFIIINVISTWRIYFLSGTPKFLNFLFMVWFHIIIIMACILIIIIYFL